MIQTKDVELLQKVVEEKYSEQMAELKKAEEDLRLKEELYRHEDEARLEKLTAQNSFVEKLNVQKVQLMCFIEAKQQSVPTGLMSRSEGHLDEVCDGWQDQLYSPMPRTVCSASGRLLTSSKHNSLTDNPALNGTTYPGFTAQPDGYKSKPHYDSALTQNGKIDRRAVHLQRTAFESSLDLCLPSELSVPWRLLSDDPDTKSRSASAPRLSDESSASSLSDETRSVLLSQLVRSSSPRATQLSTVSLASVPESVHEEHEESPVYGRLSTSEVDIRRHQFPTVDTRNRRSLDEEYLSGPNSAASIRCLTGSNQDVVITDSGLPSSPEAGRLDSSMSCDMNTTVKQKTKVSKQSGVLKSLRKSEPGILQKIGATLTNLTRRQDTKSSSVKKQTTVLPVQSVVSKQQQQSDPGVVHDSRSKCAGKAKIQVNTNDSRKTTTDQSKNTSKQTVSAVPKRYLSTSKGTLPAEKKSKSSFSVQDKPTMPAKVRESFRSFRKRLKLTAEKGQKGKSGDIPVEIFLPKPKVAEGDEDGRDLCAVEKQSDNAAVDTCLIDEFISQHVFSDTGWTYEWTGRFEENHRGSEKQSKSCDDEGQFSDDSLNGQKTDYDCQAAGFHYGHMIGPVDDGQYFLPYVQEPIQPACLDVNSDDGSFSEDSLTEDVSSCSAAAGLRELGQNPSAAQLPCNSHSASPTSAVACTAHHKSETRHNQLINEDIVDSEGHHALCASEEAVYNQCGLAEILPTPVLKIAPVSRGHTEIQTGTFSATHHLIEDNISALAAG